MVLGRLDKAALIEWGGSFFFYKVGEPESIKPYIWKKDFFPLKLSVIFAKNNLTSTADNFTCTYATTKILIYSESWDSS